LQAAYITVTLGTFATEGMARRHGYPVDSTDPIMLRSDVLGSGGDNHMVWHGFHLHGLLQ